MRSSTRAKKIDKIQQICRESERRIDLNFIQDLEDFFHGLVLKKAMKEVELKGFYTCILDDLKTIFILNIISDEQLKNN